jgi:hypothetical protein
VLKPAHLTQALPNGSYAYQPVQHSLSKDSAPNKQADRCISQRRTGALLKSQPTTRKVLVAGSASRGRRNAGLHPDRPKGDVARIPA